MSELREAINEMRNMRESYNEIAGVVGGITGIEPDITAGKAAIAEAITGKGVQTSATDTLAKMADNVSAITQSPITIDGGEMYAKQLYGSLTIPNYWNLYEVMAQLLSDGRLVNYGGILLAEYYKGYDSLTLEGAGAGGAYVVSDKDSNGQFIMYTADTTHTWNTEDDGKGNRWVAYCFADAGHGFTITDTNTSPRSIFIGRKVGTITSLVNGRLSQLVVPDGNELREFNGDFAQQWDKKVVIRNISDFTTGVLLYEPKSTECAYIQIKNASAGVLVGGAILGAGNFELRSLIVDIDNSQGVSLFGPGNNRLFFNNLSYLTIKANGNITFNQIYNSPLPFDSLNHINIIADDLLIWTQNTSKLPATCVIYVESNIKTGIIHFNVVNQRPTLNMWANVQTLKLQTGWCKDIDCHWLLSLTEANMYTYILQRLKQDETDCGDGVTITLGSTNLAKLTSEESVQLLDDLTNIYGYTFA